MITSVIKNLLYIERSVKQGTLKENQPMLVLLATESHEEVTGATFQIEVNTGRYRLHHEVLKNVGKQGKYKTLSALEELIYLLGSKKPNEARILVLIERLLTTDLNTNELRDKARNYYPNTTGKYKAIIKSEMLRMWGK
ncbi:hypothetical protein BKP35_10410 [Anaerobacillus arseniciselenatis]|uniref:Uncharacterized protein n=1 Tax=Anaerobacillus arseniciselenatis TaxID=85682 RepID=A0A1S2LLJ1_9BACI|nr:hypothetical protein [Anaerobacillus arseniciselenatis]OIJ12963.1 hypothetical protein BKP35_10410 [Anaerobacillus arseniciselenatis]